MHAPRRILLILASLWLLATGGCHRLPASWYYAWNGYPEEPFETPFQRIQTYQDLAEAAGELPSDQQEQVAARLVQTLNNEPDPLVRAQIVRSLGAYSTQSAGTALFSALSDTHEHVRIACCDVWGRRGGPQAVQALGGVLRNEKNADVRLAAVRALGNVNDQSGVPVLAGVLEDRDVAIQNRAMASLEQITGRFYGRDVNAWRSFAAGQEVPQKDRSIAERLDLDWWF